MFRACLLSFNFLFLALAICLSLFIRFFFTFLCVFCIFRVFLGLNFCRNSIFFGLLFKCFLLLLLFKFFGNSLLLLFFCFFLGSESICLLFFKPLLLCLLFRIFSVFVLFIALFDFGRCRLSIWLSIFWQAHLFALIFCPFLLGLDVGFIFMSVCFFIWGADLVLAKLFFTFVFLVIRCIMHALVLRSENVFRFWNNFLGLLNINCLRSIRQLLLNLSVVSSWLLNLNILCRGWLFKFVGHTLLRVWFFSFCLFRFHRLFGFGSLCRFFRSGTLARLGWNFCWRLLHWWCLLCFLWWFLCWWCLLHFLSWLLCLSFFFRYCRFLWRILRLLLFLSFVLVNSWSRTLFFRWSLLDLVCSNLIFFSRCRFYQSSVLLRLGWLLRDFLLKLGLVLGLVHPFSFWRRPPRTSLSFFALLLLSGRISFVNSLLLLCCKFLYFALSLKQSWGICLCLLTQSTSVILAYHAVLLYFALSLLITKSSFFFSLDSLLFLLCTNLHLALLFFFAFTFGCLLLRFSRNNTFKILQSLFETMYFRSETE